MAVSFLSSLVTANVTMSVLTLLLFFFFSVSPQAISAKARYLVWTIVLLGFLIPFRPAIGPGLIAIEAPAANYSEQTAPLPAENAKIEPEIPAAPVHAKPNAALPIGTIMFTIWGLGAAGVFCRHMAQYRKFRKITGRWSTPVSDEAALAIFQAQKTRLGLHHKDIALLACPSVTSPMLTGIIRPVILRRMRIWMMKNLPLFCGMSLRITSTGIC